MTSPTSLTPPLGTAFARTLLAAFAFVHLALTFGPGPSPAALTALALVLMVAAAAIVVLIDGPQLPAAWTAVAVVATATATALIVPWLPGRGWPGYAAWPLGAGTFIAIALALRRRSGAAWLSMGAMTAACVAWGLLGGEGALAALGLIARQLGVLLIGTLFAVGLRRAGRDVERFAALQRRQVLERNVAETELQARVAAVQRVLTQAGPTLERIAAGEDLDADARGGIIALEGRLRDEITLGPLQSEQLDAALAAARSRGVDVALLADARISGVPSAVRVRAAEWIAARLAAVQGEEFVARVVLLGQDVRVTAAVDGDVEDLVVLDGNGDL